jgi:hypothetical protein
MSVVHESVHLLRAHLLRARLLRARLLTLTTTPLEALEPVNDPLYGVVVRVTYSDGTPVMAPV